jgi:hypothetical protein
MKKKIHWHPDWKLHKIESLQLQLDFEEIIDDDKRKIAELKSQIRELKLNIILNKEEDDEEELEYFD